MKRIIITLFIIFLVNYSFAQGAGGFDTKTIEKEATKYNGIIELRNGQRIEFNSLYEQGAGLTGGGIDNFFSISFSYTPDFPSPTHSVARIYKFSKISKIDFFQKFEVTPKKSNTYDPTFIIYKAKVHFKDNNVSDTIFVRIDIWHYTTEHEYGEIYAKDDVIKSISIKQKK